MFAARMRPLLKSLREGLLEVMPVHAAQGFLPEELLELFCGSSAVRFLQALALAVHSGGGLYRSCVG